MNELASPVIADDTLDMHPRCHEQEILDQQQVACPTTKDCQQPKLSKHQCMHAKVSVSE